MNRLGVVGKKVGEIIKKCRVHTTVKGYDSISVKTDSGWKNVFVHTLVCLTYHGESKGRQVNHEDKDRQNNKPGNLYWVTPMQNTRHAKSKEGNPWQSYKPKERRLTDEQTQEVISLSRTHTLDELKEKFKVPKYLLRSILSANRCRSQSVKENYTA